MPTLINAEIHQKIWNRKNIRNSILLFLLPLSIVLPVILMSTQPPIVIIPDISRKLIPYSDLLENGKSEINYFRDDSVVVYAYTLKQGYAYPYAGMVTCPDTNHFFDMHHYNKLLITLKSSTSNSIRLFIRTFQDSVTIPGKVLSQRYNGIQIPVKRSLQTYLFSFSEFTTPEWWYENNRVIPRQLTPPDFSKVTGIDFNNGLSIGLNACDTLTITQMKFFHSNRSLNIWIGTALLAYYLVFLLIVRKKRWTKRPKDNPLTTISYKKIDLSSSSKDELEKVISFIACNFTDSDLCVQKTAVSTNLSVYKVPSIIKDNFNCSFKEYLNSIRIEEAKRLLSTTDRQVTEIAFAVGYNSPPHFNRLFKAMTKKSPREFRETIQV